MTTGDDVLLEGPGFRVRRSEVLVKAVRSGGPGGQNVNKVASKVVLRFNVERAAGLSAWVRERLRLLYGAQLTSEGDLLVASERFRDQPRNLEEALKRLGDRLRRAAERPRPRVETKVPGRARAERLRTKAKRKTVKRLRKGPAGADDE